MDHKNALIILAKWPELGKTKSRIAEETSSEFALNFSKACLGDIVSNLSDISNYDLLVGADNENELIQFRNSYGIKGLVLKWTSQDWRKALSEKISFLFTSLLKKYEKVIMIPMDVPFLPKEAIQKAFKELDKKEKVIGPEFNGGLYLIGLKSLKQGLFENVRWSTEHSCNDIINNGGGFEKFYLLQNMNDLNRVQDLINNYEYLKLNCKHSFNVLNQYGYDKMKIGEYVNFDELNLNIPVALGIIEREGKNGEEILLQIRNKPAIDLENTGKLEIPGGVIERRENAHESIIRETLEETGLKVRIKTNLNMCSSKVFNKESNSYTPFCCVQQTVGDRAYLGICFLCEPIGGEIKENVQETKGFRWVTLVELRNMLNNQPEQFFNLCVSVLRHYVAMKIQAKVIKIILNEKNNGRRNRNKTHV